MLVNQGVSAPWSSPFLGSDSILHTAGCRGVLFSDGTPCTFGPGVYHLGSFENKGSRGFKLPDVPAALIGVYPWSMVHRALVPEGCTFMVYHFRKC